MTGDWKPAEPDLAFICYGFLMIQDKNVTFSNFLLNVVNTFFGAGKVASLTHSEKCKVLFGNGLITQIFTGKMKVVENSFRYLA